MAECDLTADRAKELFDYDPATGRLTRKPSPSTKWQTVPQVQKNDERGYLRVGVRKRHYYVHRLAWLIHFGKWPEFEIDHINHDKSDNRIENLRDVPRPVNLANRRLEAKPKPPTKVHRAAGSGTVFYEAGRPKPYRARVIIGGKIINLGGFVTREEGLAALAAHQQSTGLAN